MRTRKNYNIYKLEKGIIDAFFCFNLILDWVKTQPMVLEMVFINLQVYIVFFENPMVIDLFAF